MTYPFPLSTGKTAELRLPEKLTREDAERLTAYLYTLVPEPVTIPPPPPIKPAKPTYRR